MKKSLALVAALWGLGCLTAATTAPTPSVKFSTNLQPYFLDEPQKYITYGQARWVQQFYIWSDGSPLKIKVKGGMIEGYRNRGNVQIKLFTVSPKDQSEKLAVTDQSVKPDGKFHTVTLKVPQAGLYHVTINDNGDMTKIEWPTDLPVAIPGVAKSPYGLLGDYHFFVPRGTKEIKFYTTATRGRIFAPNGKKLWQKPSTPRQGTFTVAVPSGMDGKVWTIKTTNNDWQFLNIPSLLFLHSNLALIPQEVYPQIKVETLSGKDLKDQRVSFQTVQFGLKLKPIKANTKLHYVDYHPGRYIQDFYFYSDGQPLKLQIKGGMIAHYRNRGNVIVQLSKFGEFAGNALQTKVIQEDRSVPPDGQTHQVVLKPQKPGVYKVTVNDNGDMTHVIWPQNAAVVIPQTSNNSRELVGNYYFFVPQGCKTIAFYTNSNRGYFEGPDGRRYWKKRHAKEIGYFVVNVPAGMDGKIWKIISLNGVMHFVNVPPYLGLHSNTMLIPAELKDK